MATKTPYRHNDAIRGGYSRFKEQGLRAHIVVEAARANDTLSEISEFILDVAERVALISDPPSGRSPPEPITVYTPQELIDEIDANKKAMADDPDGVGLPEDEGEGADYDWPAQEAEWMFAYIPECCEGSDEAIRQCTMALWEICLGALLSGGETADDLIAQVRTFAKIRAQSMKNDMDYIGAIPGKVPDGKFLVHNMVYPAKRVGVRGFRAWYRTTSDDLAVCPCKWAPELGKHYIPQAVADRRAEFDQAAD